MKRSHGKTVFIITLIIAILIAVSWNPVMQWVVRMTYPLEYKDTILECAQKNGIDPYLVMGLIKAESNFVPDAQSHKGAKGLMQITDSTAKWVAGEMNIEYAFENLANPKLNIELGTWYLAHLLDVYHGDIDLALCAYNAGSGYVEKWLASEQYSSDGKTLHTIPFPETKSYIEKTHKYRMKYQELYPNIL